jgi:hypothetical protein
LQARDKAGIAAYMVAVEELRVKSIDRKAALAAVRTAAPASHLGPVVGVQMSTKRLPKSGGAIPSHSVADLRRGEKSQSIFSVPTVKGDQTAGPTSTRNRHRGRSDHATCFNGGNDVGTGGVREPQLGCGPAGGCYPACSSGMPDTFGYVRGGSDPREYSTDGALTVFRERTRITERWVCSKRHGRGIA